MFNYWNWEEIDINWDALNLNWEEVGILISDVLPYVGIAPVTGKRRYNLKDINKLPEEKKRKIIKIVCKIKGEDEYIEYKYKNDEIKITAEDVDIILNEVLKNKIKVNVQNIS